LSQGTPGRLLSGAVSDDKRAPGTTAHAHYFHKDDNCECNLWHVRIDKHFVFLTNLKKLNKDFYESHKWPNQVYKLWN